MTKFRKLLALVLVMAMTFTMLPVFAAAEDVAPVEDVAVISAAPEASPAAAAIETAAAEPVAAAPRAELQAEYASDAEAVADGMVMRWDKVDGTSAYFSNPKDAVLEASKVLEPGHTLHLLRDYTVVDSNNDSNPWFAYANIQNYTTTEEDTTVYGFWLDLGGHTLTAKTACGMIGRGGGASSVNVRNGNMIWQNNTRTAAILGMFLFGVTSQNPYSGGKLTSRVTLKNMNCYVLGNATDVGPNYQPGVIASSLWTNEFRLYNSKAIATAGNGVRVIKSSATISGTGLTRYQEDGAVTRIELHEGSMLGTIGDFAVARYTRSGSGTATGIEHRMEITIDSQNDVFLGNGMFESDTGTAFTPVFVGPDAEEGTQAFETTYSIAMPDDSTIAFATALDAAPGYLDAVDYPGFYYAPHVHTPVHVEESEPTYTSPGMVEHYFCEGCGKYFYDEFGEEEADLADLEIPKLDCSHEAELEHCDPVPATFVATGVAEHWMCPICLQLFSDAEGLNPVDATELATPVLTGADAAGHSDAELVELGAVIRATAPDGSVKAFADIRDGYNEAKTWTEAGGSLVLLQDVELEDTTNNGSSGWMTGKVFDYENDEVDGMPTKGFWFDLGGHTINAKIGMPLFYSDTNTTHFNVKNGTILLANNGRTGTALFAPFVFGYSNIRPVLADTSTSPATILPGIKEATVNLYGVNVFALPNVSGVAVAGCVASAVMNTTVNVKDSKLICTNAGKAAVTFCMTTSKDVNDEYKAVGSNFILNTYGGSIVGCTDPDTAAISCAQYDSSKSLCQDGVSYTYDVNAADDTVFLGGELAAASEYVQNNYDEVVDSAKLHYMKSTRSYKFTEIGATAAKNYTAWVLYVDIGDKTDEELVALGAVVKTVAPDATVKAFNDLNDGYEEAKTWTEAGGSLVLLQDVEIVDSVSDAGGWITPIDYSYANTEVDGMPTRGFWLDLNGKTINACLGRSLFYAYASAVTNVKNGTILFTGNGRVTNSGGKAGLFGIFGYGTSAASPLEGSGDAATRPVRKQIVNLYNVKCYALGALNDTTAPSVVAGYVPNIEVNVRDSTLIATNDEQPAIEFSRPTGTATNAALEENGINLDVNVKGNSIVGSLSASQDAIQVACVNTADPIENVAYRVRFTADSTATFLGDKLISLSNAAKQIYTVTAPDRVEATCSCAFPEINLASADYTAWVDPAVYIAEDAPGLTTADNAKATLNAGGNTAYFDDASAAIACADKVSAYLSDVAVQLNAPAASSVEVGAPGVESAFALDLNGNTLPEDGLVVPGGAAGTKVTITLTGADADTVKLFKALPAVPYTSGGTYVIEKGSVFTDYSLGLADDVRMNLYTNGATAVGYVQGDTTHTIDAANEKGAWVIDTIAARQMADPIDAYAVKTVDGTVTVDFTKGISVKSYVAGDPAATLEDGDVKTALEATLKTLLIYGKFAEKYFAANYTDLTADELAELGLEAIPETDTSNLTDAAYVVTGMTDLHYATEGSGFYGTKSVLDESLRLQFYFTGDEFDGKTATVNGENVTLKPYGDYKYIEAALRARDFDAPVTVVIEGVGSVTDSMSGYTSRLTNENSANLVAALRAYGANAMRYAAAKDAAAAG